MNRRSRVAAFTVLTLVGACVSTSETALLSSQYLAVTVHVQSAKVDFNTTFVHPADDIHKCVMAARIRPATAAPDYVAGYGVVFGPDAAKPEDGGSSVPMGTVPGLPPLDNPTVKYFSLTIDPLPNQLATTGPVKLSRSFSIGLAMRGALKGRFDEADPKTSGSVTLDRDGLGGRFRLANVEPDLAHGRVAESEYVTVTGSWRCPSK